MFCQNCGSEINGGSFCQNCGTPLTNNMQSSNIASKPNNQHKKKKKKKKNNTIGCLIAFIFIVIIATALIIGAILVNNSESDSEPQEANTAVSQSEEQENIFFEDNYIKASYVKVYNNSAVEGVTYLQLHIENKSDKEITVSLSNIAVNGMTANSGTAVPITILPGNASEQPFMIFTNNTGITNADEIEKLQFSFYLMDDDLNVLEETKIIALNL